jgi:hypothetical protein
MKQTKKEQAAAAAARRAIVDEYGKLDAELAPAKARMKRLDDLAKQIRGWHQNTEAGMTVIEQGDRFRVVVGPRAETTLLADANALYEALGHARFLELAKITLGGLESAVNGDQLAALTRKERIGSRSLKAVPAA